MLPRVVPIDHTSEQYWRGEVPNRSTNLDHAWDRYKRLNVDSTDYWVKAEESLEMALVAYERKKLNVCASRAYYSVFLASIAALIQLTDLRARDNEWDPGQVQAELNRRMIMRRKVLPAELGRTPMDLMELRHLADYKPQSVSAVEAKRACDRAEKFLSSIERALTGKP